jgi:hypothetical protein
MVARDRPTTLVMTQSAKNGWGVTDLVQESIFLPFVLLSLCITLLVSPAGEFPLNDDWIYTKTVQHLLNTGQYHSHPYLNATLVLQTYWGALFCKIFGFHFTTLRYSTLVLSCIQGWAIARCGLVIGLSRPLALLCGTLVMTNPIMLGLSYSFMTDIPFLTLSTLSGLCFLKALRKFSTAQVLWGSLFGVAAFFVRQFGLLVPLAFALTLGILHYRQGPHIRPRTGLALAIPWVFAAILYLVFLPVLSSNTPILESIKGRFLIVVMDSIRYLPVALSYLGLFLLPLGIVKLWQIGQDRKRWSRQEWTIFSSFCSFSLFIFGLPQILYILKKALLQDESVWLQQYPYRMPLLPLGMLLDFGLGHVQLIDLIPKPAIQLDHGWWFITVPSVAVAGLLFMMAGTQLQFWRKWPRLKKQEVSSHISSPQLLFLWIWGGLGLLSVYNPWRLIITDRYFLVAFVPFTLILASEFRRFTYRWTLKLIALGVTLIFSVSLMLLQDYMAWNQAAWTAQQRLMTTYQVLPAEIAGTDPLNGWYNSEAYMERYHTRSWWDLNIGQKGPWVLDDQYLIAREEPRPNYKVLEHIPYFSWLGWKKQTIVIFQRLDP